MRPTQAEGGVNVTGSSSLTGQDCAWLCIFAAANARRSPKIRDHNQAQWGRIAEIVRDLATAHGMDPSSDVPVTFSGIRGKDRVASLSWVEDLAVHPLQRFLVPEVFAFSEVIARKPLRVLCTETRPGFITSDAPVSIHNEQTRYPILAAAETEVTLPLSPNQMAVWRDWPPVEGNPGDIYLDAPLPLVDRLNRRTRAYSHEKFVVQRNETKDEWFPEADPSGS
jgi:hypothetical protein